MAGFEFLAGVLGGELVVFGLDFFVGDGVLLLEVTEQFADQDGLAGQFNLGFEVFGGVQATHLGFLHENLAGDDFVLELALHFRRHGPPGALDLLSQRVHARLRNGFSIHDSHVLGHGGGRQGGQ